MSFSLPSLHLVFFTITTTTTSTTPTNQSLVRMSERRFAGGREKFGAEVRLRESSGEEKRVPAERESVSVAVHKKKAKERKQEIPRLREDLKETQDASHWS